MKANAAPSPDLFAQIAGAVPGDVMAGLSALAAGPPLWPVDVARWAEIITTVTAFAERWDGQARACGWLALALYGLHQRAPWSNLAAMGAAFLFARRGDRVLEVEASAILLVSRLGSRLRMYRMAPDADAVLAWELRAHEGRTPIISAAQGAGVPRVGA